jgi:release factor glutamine methyltransferase
VEIKSATLGELQALMQSILKDLYPERELKSILNLLFTHITGLTPARMVLEKDTILTESDIYFLQRALKRLQSFEPVQYITGKAHFHGLEFSVDANVLIPRPETEELVDWICRSEEESNAGKMLDIGTGSGCIAISLKKNLPKAIIHALDVSEGAISVARKNAASHDAEIRFLQGSILEESFRDSLGSYDLIVSNPPYVTYEDRKRMLPTVTDFEPELALFVENDPLLFYRQIINFCREHLKAGGYLYFESNEAYADWVAELLKKSGFHEVIVRQDLQGKKRMIRGLKPGY